MICSPYWDCACRLRQGSPFWSPWTSLPLPSKILLLVFYTLSFCSSSQGRSQSKYRFFSQSLLKDRRKKDTVTGQWRYCLLILLRRRIFIYRSCGRSCGSSRLLRNFWVLAPLIIWLQDQVYGSVNGTRTIDQPGPTVPMRGAFIVNCWAYDRVCDVIWWFSPRQACDKCPFHFEFQHILWNPQKLSQNCIDLRCWMLFIVFRWFSVLGRH